MLITGIGERGEQKKLTLNLPLFGGGGLSSCLRGAHDGYATQRPLIVYWNSVRIGPTVPSTLSLMYKRVLGTFAILTCPSAERGIKAR